MTDSVDHVFIPDSVLVNGFHDVTPVTGALCSIGTANLECGEPVRWPTGVTTTIHYDPIRRGYFVVREGTRWISVEGAVAGQWSSRDNHDDLAQFRKGRFTEVHGGVRLKAEEGRFVIDLHNLAECAQPITPRHVVKMVSEMREGEPQVDCGSREHCERSVRRANERGVSIGHPMRYAAKQYGHRPTLEAFIIDTHSPAWQAFNRTHAAVPIHQWSRIADRSYSCSCGAEVTELPNGDLDSLNFPSDACEQEWLAYDAARIAAYPPAWLNGATDAQTIDRLAAKLAAKREEIRAAAPALFTTAVFPVHPARICAAWALMHAWREQRLAGDTSTPPPFTMGWWAPESEDHPRVILKSVRIDGVLVTADDYTRARSLLLAVRAETSPGPAVVACEGDHPLDADNMLPDAPSTVSSWAERLLPRELR